MRPKLFTAASTLALVLSLASAAYAQNQAASDPATQAQPQDDQSSTKAAPGRPAPATVSEQPTTEVEAVTVTGSRVITNGNNAPTPVTVVSLQQMDATKPTTVFENLSALPMFSGSFGATAAPANAAPERNTSVSALNLRNLGALRDLVLFDGQRVPPTTALGYVDINTLPQMLLQRVDVVTGGASAIYGSDAVTGVVNFVVDRKFNGLRVDLQSGISRYGDDYSYRVGVAGGTDIQGGRGHIEGSYQRIYDDGIMHQTDRAWAAPRWTLQGDGTQAHPYHLVSDVNIAFATFGGLIVCPGSGLTAAACPGHPYVGYTFDDNGVLTPFEKGDTTGLTDQTVQIGGDGAYHDWPSIKSRVALDQLFGRFDYDVTDDLHAYVMVSAARDYELGHPSNLRFFGQGVNIGACNAFLPGQYQAAFGCTAANADAPPTFTLNKIFDFQSNQYAPGGENVQKTDEYFVMAGLEGEFGRGWKWNANFTDSGSMMSNTVRNSPNLGHIAAALDAVTDPATGQIVCRVTLTNPSDYPGCAPLNVFGPSAESKEALDYIFTPVSYTTHFRLDSVSASVSGSPFSLPAGPVDFAVSGEYRRQTYSLTSNDTPFDTLSCVGLRFGNCRPGVTTQTVDVFTPRSTVEQQVEEVAVEANVPLLKDRQFFQNFNLNGGARFTRYDNDPRDGTGSRSIQAVTWKIGGTWDVVDQFTLRAAYSRDIRAPNLYDLFSPVSVNPNSFTTDYLVTGHPNVSVPVVTSGNPDLKPEIAHTATVGFVWRPTPELSFAVDGYDIRIKDALATINGASQAIQQACYDSGGTSPLCALQERPNGFSDTSIANELTRVYVREVNIAEQKTHGIDFEVNYKTLLNDHPFGVRGLVTYQPSLVYSQPGLHTIDQAGVAYTPAYNLLPAPVWKATLFVHYDVTDNFSVDLAERYRSSLKWTADPAQYGVGGVSAVAYTDLTLSYIFRHSDNGDSIAYLNITNLFDKDPPPSGTPGIQNLPGYPTNGYIVGDDVVGRYFNVGVRMRF